MDETLNNESFDVKNAIQQIMEIVGNLANEVAEIKSTIMDELITPIQDEYNKMQHDEALSDWRCKYGEKLEGFNDKLKAIEGEDFDILEKSFDDFNERDDEMEADVFVDELANKVSEQLDNIALAFGVKPEEIEEVKVETEDGEVKAEVENGEVETVETDKEAEVETNKEEGAESEPETESEVEAPAETEIEAEEKTEAEERPEGSTDTPDDDEENRKYWENIIKGNK